MYKTKLPFLLAFNKIDIQSHQFCMDWMQNVEDFEAAMKSNQSYMSTLVKSLGNVLDAFYKNIRTVGVSSVTGQGIDALFEKVKECKEEYWTDYRPMIIEKMKERKQREEEEKRQQMAQAQKEAERNDTETVFKLESKKENLEKLMNLGLESIDENKDDGDENDTTQVADD